MLPQEIVVHTGNILLSEHLKRRVNLGPQEELVDCLGDALKTSAAELQGAPPEGRLLRMGSRDLEMFTDEEREDLKITVKIFLMDVSKESITSAIRHCMEHLHIKSIDLVLVSFPSNNFSDYQDAWRSLEEFVKTGAAESVGVSDFSLEELEKIYGTAQVKPSVNQVNLESCCVIPPELSEFAKSHQIQLLTHNDPRTMLSAEATLDILNSCAPFLKPAEWSAQWLVRYAAMVKLRGVVKSRGFIFSVHQKK